MIKFGRFERILNKVGARHNEENWTPENAVTAIMRDGMQRKQLDPDYRKLEGFCWALKLSTNTERQDWQVTMQVLERCWIKTEKLKVNLKIL